MKKLLIIGCLTLLAFATPAKKKIRLWLIGDSTMASKEISAYPETGWGMPFAYFFDSSVEVNNQARNGRSTQSFIDEKLWQPVFDNMREGDYVFIQFGHNDEVITKAVHTSPEQFTANLERYVNETRMKKAIPVLITPVARRKFDSSTGKIMRTHDKYSALVRSVAAKQNVLLIDLDMKSQALFQQLGPETSKYLFNWLEPGEHPNYPQGKQDDTHFSDLGARRIAELVLGEIRSMDIELKDRIIQPVKK